MNTNVPVVASGGVRAAADVIDAAAAGADAVALADALALVEGEAGR